MQFSIPISGWSSITLPRLHFAVISYQPVIGWIPVIGWTRVSASRSSNFYHLRFKIYGLISLVPVIEWTRSSLPKTNWYGRPRLNKMIYMVVSQKDGRWKFVESWHRSLHVLNCACAGLDITLSSRSSLYSKHFSENKRELQCRAWETPANFQKVIIILHSVSWSTF